MVFDPFASGLAAPAAPTDKPPAGGFDPFASGEASAPAAGQSLPTGTDPAAHWRTLYSGLDGLDRRVDESQRAAFAAMDKVVKEPKEARARAVNQSFVADSYGLHGPWVENNWDSVKVALAEKEFGVKDAAVDERWLYGKIAERLGASGNMERFVQDELKPWTWRDDLRSGAGAAGRGVASFWESINRPLAQLPDPPDDLPDQWHSATTFYGSPVATNPAVAAGVYKGAVKPLLESLESPLGIATLGVGTSLKEASATVPAARYALAGMGGFFTALMGYATAKATPDAIKVALDGRSSTQDKVAALSGVAGTATMTVLGAFGTAFELLPDKGAKVAKAMEGKTPTQSADVLRREAITATPEAGDALNRAATTLEEIGAYERGPDAWQAKPVGGERIAAAAVRTPDGNVVEAPTHDQARAQLSGAPEVARNEDGTWRVASPEGGLAMDGLKDEAEARKVAAAMVEGADQPSAVAKVGEALAGEPKGEEGFVTSAGRFVSREEARAIAENAGQIKPAEAVEPSAPGAEPLASSEPKPLHAHEVEMDPEPEFARSAFGQTSLKNAYNELERMAYFGEEMPPTQRVKVAESMARAAEIMQRNPKAGEQLTQRLLDNPNAAITPDQKLVILRHKVGVMNALNEAADLASDPNSSVELKAEAQRQVGELSDELRRILDASQRRASEVGRELRWQQIMQREDYSFAAQETLLRAAKGGAELTEGERERLIGRVKALEEAQARYEAKIAELQAQPREAAVEGAVRAMAKPPREPRRFRGAESVRDKLHAKAEESKKFLFQSGRLFSPGPDVLYHLSVIGADHLYSTGLDFAEWSAAMVRDLGEKAKPLLADAWEASKKLFHAENRTALIDELKSAPAEERAKKLGPYAQELARAKIEEGVKGRDAVVDAVWSDLKEAIPEITRRDAMDAISGYGKFKPLSRDAIAEQLRDLKGQLQQVAKLQDMAAGQAPKKTGVERRTPSDEERALVKQVEAKKKEGGYVVTDPERQLRTALQSVKRNLDNRIKDLAREFETGEKPPRGKPAPTDAQAEILKAFRDRVAKVLEDVEGKPEATPEERIKRSVEATTAAIDRLEDDLQKGKIFPEGGEASEPWSPALGKLKAQLEDLRDFRKEMQRLAKPPRSPEDRALAGVKAGLKRQIESLERQIETRVREAKAKKSTALDAEAEGLKARRDDLKEDFERVFGRKELSDEQRLNIWKVAARKRLADLEERLANKDFAPRERRPLPMDDEAARLKGQIERLRQDFWIERAKAEEAGRPGWQKALTTSANLARASALSGYHTIGKLATFSLARLSEAPVYEAAGAALRRIPGVAEVGAKANLETGAEYSALARFYRKAATAGMRDALETLKTGKSGLKAELGDPRHNAEPVHWYDYCGILHMSEKSPLLRADFELRLEKITQWAIANGLDVEDPLVAGALRKDAFEYAQRAILMENNSLATAINTFTRQLEAANPKTGKVDVLKAGLSWFVKTFMTKGIVRTPANYVAQTFARTPLGLAKGTAQLVVSHMHGVEKLTPEEANAIMRLLKVGAVGTGVFIWGMIDASKNPKDRIFGGYYQPGDKRGQDDVGFGRIRVGGVEFPHILTHNPLTESAQMGSTFYRVMKQKLKKRGKGSEEEKGALAGAATALISLASEAPVISPITREVQQLERGEAHKLVWDEVAGLVPMFVQNLAVDLDDNKSRRPETFEQAIENVLPGMRQNVPETKAQRERDVRQRLKK